MKITKVKTISLISLAGISALLSVTAFNQNSFSLRASADEHVNEVELGRDELTVDITSITKTSSSKSATIVFNSTRLTGWGTSKQNVFVVIDDPNYSGSPSDPALDGTLNPTFAGYTIEMANIATFTFSYTDTEKHSWTDLVVPTTLTYGDSFSIKNTKILKDSLIFSDAVGTKAKFDYLVIPKGITEIESNAIQNVPVAFEGYNGLKIRCEAESKPAGWANDWCDADPSMIEWGYKLKGEETTGKKTGNETNHLTESTGTYSRYYGKLENAFTDSAKVTYSIVDDPNWTGNFDNPVRTSEGLVKPYRLKSAICTFDDNSATGSDLYLPVESTYGTDLVLTTNTILKGAFDFSKNLTSTVTNIYIPSEILYAQSGAFKFKNDDKRVNIYCEAASKPAGWNDNWTNLNSSNIHWGAAYAGSKNVTVADTSFKFRTDNEAKTYCLGYKWTKQDTYFCSNCKTSLSAKDLKDSKCPKCGHDVITLTDVTPEYNLPIVVTYNVKKGNGDIREVKHEMPLLSEEPTSTSTSYFDSVKTNALSRSFDILLEDGETLLEDSFAVHNIYRLTTIKKETLVVENGEVVKKWLSYSVPDTSVAFSSKVLKRFKQEIDIDRVVKCTFNNVSTFNSYFMVRMDMDKVLKPHSFWYDAISETTLESVKPYLDDGSYSLRYALYNLNNSFYRVTYTSSSSNETIVKTLAIKAAASVCILEKDVGNNISFVLQNSYIGDDFKPSNLLRFEIIGLTVNIHCWNNEKSLKVSRTDVSIHFGAVDVMPLRANAGKVRSLDVIAIIVVASFIALYAVVAVALYFILKNKYKNDEFKRMNTKGFIKGAVFGLIGGTFIVVTVLFIIFRFNLFANALAVHNPVDLFVVIPGVISIIFIGYFIKFLVVKLKTEKKRKQIVKLKLNDSNEDDGTK